MAQGSDIHRGSVPSTPDPRTGPGEGASTPHLTFTLSEIFDQPSHAAQATPGAPSATSAHAKDPGVAQALARGEQLFPDSMKESRHAIEKALVAIMPLTFETLATFGEDELARVAELVGRASAMTTEMNKVDVAKEVAAIVADAGRARGKVTLLDLVGIQKRFDLHAAEAHIDAIRAALTTQRYGILQASIDLERAMLPFAAEITVMRILAKMAEQPDLATLVARKGELFNASMAEATMAKKQLDSLQKLAQEGILQCEELKTVTLPAMGFRQSL